MALFVRRHSRHFQQGDYSLADTELSFQKGYSKNQQPHRERRGCCSHKVVAVGLYNMISAMRYTGDWGGMFASVVIVFLPTFMLYLFLSEKIIRGVTGGAIKG